MIPEHDKEYVDPKKLAAVAIDMHLGHVAEDAPIPCPRGRAAIPIADRFLAGLRPLHVPIVHVLYGSRRGGADRRLFPPHNFYSSVLEKNPRIWEHNVEGSRYCRSAVVVDEKDHLINTKRRYSAFYATDLELLLRNLGVDTILMFGIMTDNCVLNSAFDAVNMDFKVLVVNDCSAGSSADMEEAALKIIAGRLGWVASSEEVLRLIEDKVAHQSATQH